MTELDVRLLAPMCLIGPDGEVRPRSIHVRALIARLALGAKQYVTYAALRDALWGSASPASTRSNLRKYLSATRSALREAGVDDEAVLTVIPAHRGSGSSGMVRLAVDRTDVDLLAAAASVGRAAQLLSTCPGSARDEADRAIEILDHGVFAADLPDTEWFASYAARVHRQRERLREVRCLADILVGDVYRAHTEAQELINRGTPQYTYLAVGAFFLGRRSAEALDLITRERRNLGAIGLDLPEAMSSLQVAVLNADEDAVNEALLRCCAATA